MPEREEGITYASVTSGHLGFGPDAPISLLPACVELVADRAVSLSPMDLS